MIQNVVIGMPLIDPWHMFSRNQDEWNEHDKNETLFTDERFLPKILVECGVVKSINEVRRNKPNLVKTLDTPDFLEVKWGKKRVFIQVGN